MKRIVPVFIVFLAILHQDFWWWNDIEPLALGFLPIGLAYHALISILAGVGWAFAVHYCWPKNLDDADYVPTPGSNRGDHP
jgi:hypothetical protein